MRHLALVALLAFAPVAARAEPPADAPAVAVAKEQPAPFSGVLVSEPRMVLYLGQQAQLEACTVKLQLRDDALLKRLRELAHARASRWLLGVKRVRQERDGELGRAPAAVPPIEALGADARDIEAQRQLGPLKQAAPADLTDAHHGAKRPCAKAPVLDHGAASI